MSEPVQRRRCKAHRSSDGEPCGNWAIKGGFVCRYHGGSTPQVKAAADRRWREFLEAEALPSLTKMRDLRDGGSERAQLAAAKDLLDRGGIRVEDDGPTVDVRILWPE